MTHSCNFTNIKDDPSRRLKASGKLARKELQVINYRVLNLCECRETFAFTFKCLLLKILGLLHIEMLLVNKYSLLLLWVWRNSCILFSVSLWIRYLLCLLMSQVDKYKIFRSSMCREIFASCFQYLFGFDRCSAHYKASPKGQEICCFWWIRSLAHLGEKKYLHLVSNDSYFAFNRKLIANSLLRVNKFADVSSSFVVLFISFCNPDVADC